MWVKTLRLGLAQLLFLTPFCSHEGCRCGLRTDGQANSWPCEGWPACPSLLLGPALAHILSQDRGCGFALGEKLRFDLAQSSLIERLEIQLQ